MTRLRTGEADAQIGGDPLIAALGERVRAVVALNPMTLIRLMRGRRSGSIANIGPVAGEIGIGGGFPAAEFGLRGIHDSVRRELTLAGPGFLDRAPFRPGRRGTGAAPKVLPGKCRAANTQSFVAGRLYAAQAARK